MFTVWSKDYRHGNGCEHLAAADGAETAGIYSERLGRDRNRRPAARRILRRRDRGHCGDRPLLWRHRPTAGICWDGPRSDTNLLAGAPLAREFWTWLGLSYASIDIDGSPGSIPLDLNYDEVPTELVGRYDVVTNFGTTEHVANQLQSFKIIHDLATAGAIMLHVLPASGTPNHGLVSYNPKFFWMLGRSNGYKITFMTMGQSERDAGLPSDLLEFLELYEPQAKSDFAAFRMPVTSIVVALQKVFDTPFVAPLDVPTGAMTEHAGLRDRYWSVLKPDASFQARERDLLARIREVHSREQSLAAGEVDLAQRKRDVYEREQYVAAREWTAHMLFAPIRAMYKLRRWLHARAPRWLIAAKRKMFGIAAAKSDGTPSRGT